MKNIESQPLVYASTAVDQELQKPIIQPEPKEQRQISKSVQKPVEPTLEYSWKLFFYMLCGTVLYYMFCQPVLNFSLRFPAVNTHSEWFRSYYFRGTFNTTYIDFGTFFYYIILMVIGYSYVVVVTLAYRRRSMFIGRDGKFVDIKWLFIYGISFYFICGLVVVRQRTDLSSYCTNQPQMHNNLSTEQLVTEFQATTQDIKMKPLHKLFDSIQKMDYLSGRIGKFHTQSNVALQSDMNDQTNANPFIHAECKIYTKEEVFNYNYYIYTAGFFLGLQFTHLDTSLTKGFILTPSIMAKWPLYFWLIFLSLCTLLIQIFAYMITIYSHLDLLWFYARWILTLFAFVSFNNWRYANKKQIHLHHYNFAQVVMIFTCYENIVVTFINAVATGVMVEGIARWGADDIWEDIKEPFEYTKEAEKHLDDAAARDANFKDRIIPEEFIPDPFKPLFNGEIQIHKDIEKQQQQNQPQAQYSYEIDEQIGNNFDNGSQKVVNQVA